jgi:hypothetical protein
VVVAAQANRSQNVFFVARNYNSERYLPVIGPVSGIESATARIEADFSPKMPPKSVLKRGSIKLRGIRRSRGDVLQHKLQNIFEDASLRRKPDDQIPEIDPGFDVLTKSCHPERSEGPVHSPA